MQQFFGLVNALLAGDPGTARRCLHMVVYKVRSFCYLQSCMCISPHPPIPPPTEAPSTTSNDAFILLRRFLLPCVQRSQRCKSGYMSWHDAALFDAFRI